LSVPAVGAIRLLPKLAVDQLEAEYKQLYSVVPCIIQSSEPDAMMLCFGVPLLNVMAHVASGGAAGAPVTTHLMAMASLVDIESVFTVSCSVVSPLLMATLWFPALPLIITVKVYVTSTSGVTSSVTLKSVSVPAVAAMPSFPFILEFQL
jgi:hypothetical protein